VDDLVSHARFADALRPDGLSPDRVNATLNLFGPAARSLWPALIAVMLIACEQPPVEPLPADVAAIRIVSLSPHLTELTFAAGAGQQLVGVVEFSDYPAAAADIPRIGDAFRVDYEAISLLHPDVVLAWRSGTPREIIERLRSLGYRVVELNAGQLEDIVKQLLAIGRLAGTESAAQIAAANLQAKIAALRARYRDQPSVSVFFQISSEPLFSITGAHVISDIIELCGGRNVFAELSGIAPPVSVEAVAAADPDIIMATGGDSNWTERWQRLTQLKAVQREQLYNIDRDLISRPGPRMIEGAVEICEALDKARAAANQDSASGG
jgi:iron complex transport system substrate-binding protein